MLEGALRPHIIDRLGALFEELAAGNRRFSQLSHAFKTGFSEEGIADTLVAAYRLEMVTALDGLLQVQGQRSFLFLPLITQGFTVLRVNEHADKVTVDLDLTRVQTDVEEQTQLVHEYTYGGEGYKLSAVNPMISDTWNILSLDQLIAYNRAKEEFISSLNPIKNPAEPKTIEFKRRGIDALDRLGFPQEGIKEVQRAIRANNLLGLYTERSLLYTFEDQLFSTGDPRVLIHVLTERQSHKSITMLEIIPPVSAPTQ